MNTNKQLSTIDPNQKVIHSKEVIVDEESNSEEEEKPLPAVLDEPVDHEAVVYSKNKKKYNKKVKEINLNVPPEQPVLLESESPKEFDYMEDRIKELEAGIAKSGFFEKPKKELPKTEQNEIKLVDWEQQYSNLFKNLKGTIPLIVVNNVYEFFNIPRFQTFVNSIRKHNKNSIVIVNGNFYSGSGFSSTSFNGKNMIDLFNKCKIDFVTFGKNDYLSNENDFISRIKEFNGTVICSNLTHYSEGKYKKLSKTTSFLIRTIYKTKILFMAVSPEIDNGYLKGANVQGTILLLKKILELQEGKFDVCILLSTLEHSDNIIILDEINNINILYEQNEFSNSNNYKNTKICNTDFNLKTISVNLIHKTSIKKVHNIDSHLIPLDNNIPEDKELLLTVNYWKDLGFRELNIFNKIDPNERINEFKNKLDRKKIQTALINKIETLFKMEDINCVCIPEKYIDIDLSNIIYAYDIYRMIPENDFIVIIEIDYSEYTDVCESLHIKNKILFDSKISNKIKMCTTEQTINKYMLDYISGEHDIKVYTDCRVLLMEMLKDLI
jgi:hypothetical protein